MSKPTAIKRALQVQQRFIDLPQEDGPQFDAIMQSVEWLRSKDGVSGLDELLAVAYGSYEEPLSPAQAYVYIAEAVKAHPFVVRCLKLALISVAQKKYADAAYEVMMAAYWADYNDEGGAYGEFDAWKDRMDEVEAELFRNL